MAFPLIMPGEVDFLLFQNGRKCESLRGEPAGKGAGAHAEPASHLGRPCLAMWKQRCDRIFNFGPQGGALWSPMSEGLLAIGDQ